MKEDFINIIKKGCESLGIGTDDECLDKLYRYYTMVIEKNKVMNLTAITEEDEFALKHIIDSLSLVKIIELDAAKTCGKGLSLIDVGTGAGFPGMVLKIVYPNLKITLFDSLKKRLNFLDEVTAELHLEDICTLHGRAEDIGRSKEYREKFDLAVSRAVANMSTLSEYCLPLVKKDGCFVAYKSGDSDKELDEAKHAVKILGGEIDGIAELKLPDSDIERKLIKIKKIKHTPAQYPRKAGTPGKEPLH